MATSVAKQKVLLERLLSVHLFIGLLHLPVWPYLATDLNCGDMTFRSMHKRVFLIPPSASKLQVSVSRPTRTNDVHIVAESDNLQICIFCHVRALDINN